MHNCQPMQQYALEALGLVRLLFAWQWRRVKIQVTSSGTALHRVSHSRIRKKKTLEDRLPNTKRVLSNRNEE